MTLLCLAFLAALLILLLALLADPALNIGRGWSGRCV